MNTAQLKGTLSYKVELANIIQWLNIALSEGETEIRKVHRKIVDGVLVCGCALFTLYGASRVAERAENLGVPVSITGMKEVLPIIILDAGHGAST